MRVGIDGLLKQSVEEHSSGAGVAAVEPEGELVEVVGHVLVAESIVQRAGGPSLEQRGHHVWSGHDGVGVLDLVSALGSGGGQVGVAQSGEPGEHACPVGVDLRAGGDDLGGEVDHVRSPWLAGNLEADPAKAAACCALARDGDRSLVAQSPWLSCASAAEEALVEFYDDAGIGPEQLAVGTNHCPAELVQPGPRGLIGPESQGVLEALRRDAVLLRRHEPYRGEPRRERGVGTVEDRPGRDRGLQGALDAHSKPSPNVPTLATATARARETSRPAEPGEILPTSLVIRKPGPKLLVRPRVVHPAYWAGARRHFPSLLHSSRDAGHSFSWPQAGTRGPSPIGIGWSATSESGRYAGRGLD